jgi:hypothetical protein
VAITSKTSSDQEEVLDVLLIAMCPFLSAGHNGPAPLPLVVVVMVPVCESAEHQEESLAQELRAEPCDGFFMPHETFSVTYPMSE